MRYRRSALPRVAFGPQRKKNRLIVIWRENWKREPHTNILGQYVTLGRQLVPKNHPFPALYGALFGGHEEAGFSNYRLWESLGFLFAYILQTQVCIDVKLWILTAFLGIGMGGYLVVESMEWKRKKAERPAAEKIT